MKVEISPGRVANIDLKGNEAPTHVISKLVKVDSSGLMRAVPVEWTPEIPLTTKNLKKLGIYIPTYVINRLVRAGFIKGGMVTPRLILVNLASLLEHLQATRCDEDGSTDFWTKDRRSAYTSRFGAIKEGGR